MYHKVNDHLKGQYYAGRIESKKTEKARPGMDWKELALHREIWRQIC